eukprot:1718940-Amphidinium_carterae.1
MGRRQLLDSGSKTRWRRIGIWVQSIFTLHPNLKQHQTSRNSPMQLRLQSGQILSEARLQRLQRELRRGHRILRHA